jgi:hypothetical protein
MAGARAESSVRAARASAALEGAELPLDQVRRLVGVRPVVSQGNAVGPQSTWSPVERTVLGALRVTAASAEIGTILSTAPAQAFAKLHLAAAADQAAASADRADRAAGADRAELGRPRPLGVAPRDLVDLGSALSGPELAARLDALGRLILRPTEAPVLVLAAVAQGELLTLRPFVSANGLVARAVGRALVVARGLDPTGVAVPEVGLLSGGPASYVTMASAYSSGTARGLAAWIQHCATAVEVGAREGVLVADAVLAGRLEPDVTSESV